MPCSYFPEDCGADHIAPRLQLRCTGRGQWSGSCPVCHGERKFSLATGTRGRRFVWTCHRRPACSSSSLYEAMLAAGVSEQCLGRPGGKHRKPGDPDLKAVEDLIAEDWRSPAGLRIRIAALLWQLPPAEAAGKLGYSDRTWRRIRSEIPGRERYR